MSLVLYSSSESDTDERQSVVPKKEETPANNDRVRLFPHEEGNWALSVYAFGKYRVRRW